MRIAENIWLLEASRAKDHAPGFHCYLVKDEEGLTLIDTSLPGRGEEILNEIRVLGYRPEELRRIFLTHTDLDHIGNARMLQDMVACKGYVSEEEKKYLTGERKRLPKKAEMFQGFLAPEVLIYPEDLGEYQVIPTPGHTAGHVCILYRDCLFAGDCCSTESGAIAGPEEAFTEDMETALQSLKKVSLYSFGSWCPCHGMPKNHLEP